MSDNKSVDRSKDVAKVLGVPVRKANLGDFPPALAYVLGSLGLDIENAYQIDVSQLDSDDSKN